MKKSLAILLAILLLASLFPLSVSAACGIAGHRVIEPTCTEEGACYNCGIIYAALGHRFNEMGICTNCGEKKDSEPSAPSEPSEPPTDPDECLHRWELVLLREPTCREDGVRELYCTDCYETSVEVLPATDLHEYDWNGRCVYCGAMEETEPTVCAHRWEELMYVEPTCINEGVWERYCILCYYRNVEFFPATGEHEYNEEGYCDYCGAEQETEPDDPEIPDVPCKHMTGRQPTCTETGFCYDCGMTFAPLGHAFNEMGVCDYCGEKMEIPPVDPDVPCNHENRKESTCITEGYCYDCGMMFAPLEHKLNEKGACVYCGTQMETPPEDPDDPVAPGECLHQWVDGVTKAPTCGKEGLWEYYCTLCYERHVEKLPATGEHIYDDDYDQECNTCGQWREVEPVECEHKWIVRVMSTPTCINEGIEKHSCTLCGEVRTEIIPATGEHEYNEEGYCDYCGAEQETEPDDPEIPDVPCKHMTGRQPTCTETGFCYDCGMTFAPLGHAFNEMGVCDYCGEKMEIPPVDPDDPEIPDDPEHPVCEHEYEYDCSQFCALCGELTRPEAHCQEIEQVEESEEGFHILNYVCCYCDTALRGDAQECYGGQATCAQRAVCIVCDREYGAYAAHEYDAEVIEPDCENGGYVVYTCIHCDDRYVGDETPALGHNYTAEVTAPDCENGGYTTYICTICNDWYEGDETAPLAHNYDAEVIEPDCENGGYTIYTCIHCDDWYEGDETAPLGHDYDAEVVEPDCENSGYTSYICIHCGDWYEGEEIPALGHDYVAEVTAPTCEDEGYTTYTCRHCDDWYEADEAEALGHTYKKVTTKATLTKDGSIKNVCQACGYTASKVTTIYKASKISLSKTTFTYNGKEQKPTVTVKDSKGNTIASSNYTVTYASGLKNVGTYKVTITFKGDYSGTKELSYKINPVSVSNCTISLSKTSFTYTGKEQKPTVTVKNASGTKLTTSSYTVTYASGCKNAGTYKVTVKMKGNYSGTKTLTFTIKGIDVSKCKISLSKTSFTYNGKEQKPTVTVKNASDTQLTTSSYTVTYATGRKNPGTYKVTVKFKGNYTGTKALTYTIKPVKTTVKATAAKKSLKLTIAKKTTQVTGYEVQYATTKAFTSYKSKIITSYKTTSLTLSGLKAKTTYYVRVRTYKTVNGKKIYSDWSTIVTKKTK